MTNGIPTNRIAPVSEVFSDDGLRWVAAAAEAGDLAQVRAIAMGVAPPHRPVDLDAVQPSGINLLMYEIAVRNEPAVRTILDAGANPNILTPEGASPMLVAGASEDPRWLVLLLDKGGDPKLKNSFGEPLLTLLVPYGRWDNMQLLLDRGAPIDDAGLSGQTATFLLGALHQFDRVYTMLERGADPDRLDINGLRLRDFVLQRTPPDSPQELWRKRVGDRIGVPI